MMKTRAALMCFLISGCSFGETKESIKTVDSSTAAPMELPAGLTGTSPSADIPPPVFSALNFDGTARNQENLIGHPTVMWFFPFAGTPG